MTTNNIQKMIDGAVEEFRQRVEEILNPLSDTEFRCVDTDGRVKVMDTHTIRLGTVILIGDLEVFRTTTSSDRRSWVDYNGDTYTSEDFVKMLRNQLHMPKIVHMGL